jgi:hypothetical protein
VRHVADRMPDRGKTGKDIAILQMGQDAYRKISVEKKRELVRRTDVDALIDEIAGTVLTHLSGTNARCSRDMLGRRNIDAVVTQIRRDISEACSQAADARNEPLLDEQ